MDYVFCLLTFMSSEKWRSPSFDATCSFNDQILPYDIEEYPPKRDWGNTLFSKQFCAQLLVRIVKINDVVQKFIDSSTISEAERKSLGAKKVADQKLAHLLTIITEQCNINDFKAFKAFIDILGDTNNADISHKLSLIYTERVNHVATLSQLSREKSLVVSLKKELSSLESTLEKKEIHFKKLKQEKEKLDEEKKAFGKEKLSLENQIKKNKNTLLSVEKEVGRLTIKKKDLENEVEVKSNAIRKREEDITEKEREVREAIQESVRLRLEIDTLQAMGKNQKIEKLEEELAVHEQTIINLRKNKTMTREEIEEEFGNITKAQERKLDDLKAMMKEQVEQAKQDNDDMKETLKMMFSLLKKN